MLVFFGGTKKAHAVPSFARKYKTSCVTCHTVFPKLNPFGEAFRRNGFRFPSKDGSLDSDNVQAQMLPLGQDEYKKLFPNSVWPDSITQAVPLSVYINLNSHVNLPDSSAKAAEGSTFAWNDMVGEAALFAAGAFNDKLTYFVEMSIADGGISPEQAYLMWNDIVGPRHAFNLYFGAFFPRLTSFGSHGTYLADSAFPAVSIGQLFNPDTPNEVLGEAFGHSPGIALQGTVAHRVDYSLGWKASGLQDGLDGSMPNSQDAYAHIGFKIGGMSLDGEGPSGAQVANPKKPWADTALTVDVYGYHSLARFDSQTLDANGNPVLQDDNVNALGGQLRIDVGSFSLSSGGWVEHHSNPYVATTAGDPGPPVVPGTADTSPGTGLVQYNELDYVVFPWFVPTVRTEYTRLWIDTANGGGTASMLKIQPGIAFLFRPNIKLALAADIENATGTPPSGDWGAAGDATIAGQPSGKSKTEAEQITANVGWAF